MSSLSLELMKLRRSKLWLPILLLPLLSMLFGTANYLGNRQVLTHQWLSLFTQVYLFYGMFFFPALVGLVLAFIWHNEHRKNGLKLMLLSTYSHGKMIGTKMLVATGLVFVAQLLLFACYSIVGLVLKFDSTYPISLLSIALLTTLFILPLISLQSYLSLRIHSFAAPSFVALFLGFIGIMAVGQSQFPALAYLFSFSKFVLLLNNAASGSMLLSWIEISKYILVSSLLTFVFYLFQLTYLKKMSR
ncbi:ABC transporter permease [Streptococcus gallolyticus]|uniref:ABC transporter permease n=1 Tax=Streptococcus hepaticus TaxID=3349163 RepID=UPI001C979592|nr:ABC transporter permease [Streptococcus gallolyticus]MBY5040119.1 ABC transporter permease [Streptococcus gallolyticus]